MNGCDRKHDPSCDNQLSQRLYVRELMQNCLKQSIVGTTEGRVIYTHKGIHYSGAMATPPCEWACITEILGGK